MPRQTRLKWIGAIYYFTASIPKDLVAVVGRKDICHSLRTSDVATAWRLCSLESVRADSRFPSLQVSMSSTSRPSDGEDKSERRLKNQSSKSKVPIHAELLKLGFMEFLAQRKLEGPNARLFTEIVFAKATKRYSTTFSKLFSRFLDKMLGEERKASFRSFRHISGSL